MKLLIPFAAAALVVGAAAAPSQAMPVATHSALSATAQGGDVQEVRWTGRHVRVRHFRWSRGRHYGWTRGRHYGWRHSRHGR